MPSSPRTLDVSSNDTLESTETGSRAYSTPSERICTRYAPQKDPIVSFLERLAEFTADRMPER